MATNGPSIIVLGFETKMEKDPKTGTRTRPVDYVTFAPRHSPTQTHIRERVSMLDPANLRLDTDDESFSMKANFMRARWDAIKPAYDAWKEGKEVPLDGISLAAWPAVSEAQIDELRKSGIKTVQDVAAITDTMIGRIQLPNVRGLKDEAKLFLENTDKASLANKVSEQDATIAQMAEEMAAMRALLEEKTKPKGKEAA
jgi:ATP-dependent Clp protease ATP-binding subunit ClpA